MPRHRSPGRNAGTTPILWWAPKKSLWSDYFAREKDRLLLECEEARLDHHTYGNVTLDFRYDRVTAEGHVFMLDDMTQISGVARELVIPREAMGRGDLKFLAAIGAFLGWRAVLFSLFAGSLLGSIDWPDHIGRGKTGLVSKAAVWTLSGVRCAELDVFWQSVSALVRGIAEPVTRESILSSILIPAPALAFSRNMIFTNARLIFPDGIRDGLEVVVEKGKIAAIREQGNAVRKREFLTSMEIISRPALSIFTCTVRCATTPWKVLRKRFKPSATIMPAVARLRFC